MPQKTFDEYLTGNPWYQSQEWLNLAGDHRESLGLPFDMIEEKEGMTGDSHDYKKNPKETDERERRIRLVTIRGIKDFDRAMDAQKYLHISPESLCRWIKNGRPGRRARNWPDWLLCLRYL